MARGRARAASAAEVAALIRGATGNELDELVGRYANDQRKAVRSAVRSARRRREREGVERRRVEAMYALQAELGGTGCVLGVDEVGRGAVAGPLTVAAVMVPSDPVIWGLNDSKQLTPVRRELVAARVMEVAGAVGLAHVEPGVIDRVGMAAALRHAMTAAIADAGVDPDVVLIDGNPVHVHEREVCVVRGDARVACIAAASVVAKVTRDALMRELDVEYPGYHLADCKGYASRAHVEAIRSRGLTEAHRASFCVNFLEAPRLF